MRTDCRKARMEAWGTQLGGQCNNPGEKKKKKKIMGREAGDLEQVAAMEG